MVVRTDTGAVRRLQRSALRLLLSAHHIDCRRCVANRRCALQMLARALNVRFKVEGLRDLSRREPQERTLPGVVHDPGKCVLCGRCVRCARESGQGVFQFSHRGLRTRIAMFPTDAPGNAAGACWQECPVGALFPEEG
jgi:NADH dehydrogenase/NADH:ubiquinone oxidoreductase subunit G